MRIIDWISDVCSSDLVDLEEDAFAPKIEGAEVSFRAVAGAKVIPADGGEEFSLGNDFTNRVFFACETSEAGAGHDKASGRIETLAATVVQTGDLFCNGDGHAASFRPALNCSSHSAMAGRSEEHTSELQSLMRIS